MGLSSLLIFWSTTSPSSFLIFSKAVKVSPSVGNTLQSDNGLGNFLWKHVDPFTIISKKFNNGTYLPTLSSRSLKRAVIPLKLVIRSGSSLIRWLTLYPKMLLMLIAVKQTRLFCFHWGSGYISLLRVKE